MTTICTAQTIVQKKVYGTYYSDQKAFDVETDECGNIFTCGILKGATPDSLDTVLIFTYSGFGTGVIAKHSIDGTVIWARTFGSNCFNGACAYYDISTDTLCNIYACGDIACGDLIIDQDTFPTSGGRVIVKYDQNGNRLWYKIFETPSSGFRFGIDYSKSGFIYVATSFYDSINVEGQMYYTSVAGDYDPMVIKMRENGSVVWVKKFGGPTQELSNAIATDDSGKFYFSGQFHGGAIFDQDTINCFGTWGDESSYLVSCDSSGNVHRARTHGYGADYYRVNKDGKGGWISSAEQGLNAMHAKLNYTNITSAYYGQSNQTGGIDPPKAYGACSDPNGNMFVTGCFDEHFSLSGNGNSRYVNYPGNRYESYLGVYDNSEVLIGLINIPNPGYNDAGNAVAFLPPNLVLVAGEEGEFTGNKNYFLAIYDVATLLQTVNLSEPRMVIYPNPVHDELSVLLNNITENELTVEIYSTIGTRVKAISVKNQSDKKLINFNTSDLPSGIYMLRITGAKTSLSKKIIKE